MKERKHYMNSKDTVAMGDAPRDHGICKDKTGSYRPGKTAQDRARRPGGHVKLAPVVTTPAKKKKR